MRARVCARVRVQMCACEHPVACVCVNTLCLSVRATNLCEHPLTRLQAAQGRDEVTVAVRSGVLLATAFHPELTTDLRW